MDDIAAIPEQSGFLKNGCNLLTRFIWQLWQRFRGDRALETIEFNCYGSGHLGNQIYLMKIEDINQKR